MGRDNGYAYKVVLHGRHVIVKRPSKPSEIGPEADNEIQIISKIQSPRLVDLVGFSNDTKHRLLMVEFMSNDMLYDILHSTSRPPNLGRRIRLALQTTKAIDTLHSSNPLVIHCYVKSANVLIDRNFNARLGVIGLALQCDVGDHRLRSTPATGTMGYIDPCYVTSDSVNTKSDMLSFGILLLEIVSGRKAINVGYSSLSIVEWAIPLAKKGKVRGIYETRVRSLKTPL